MKIALFKGNGLVSRLIRWQTRSDYSHAAVIGPSGEVYESREFKGVRKLRTLAEAAGVAKVDVFEVQTVPEQDLRILAYLDLQVGKGYDYWSILRFVSRRNKENRWSRSRLFCSEYVFLAFAEAGIALLSRVESSQVSPALLSMSPLLDSLTTNKGENETAPIGGLVRLAGGLLKRVTP